MAGREIKRFVAYAKDGTPVYFHHGVDYLEALSQTGRYFQNLPGEAEKPALKSNDKKGEGSNEIDLDGNTEVKAKTDKKVAGKKRE